MRYFQSCYYSKLLGLNSQFRNILDQIESELELSLCRYSVQCCIASEGHLQVPQDAGVACAGVVAVVLVDAELESLAVHVVGQRLDAAREPRRVRLQQPAPATTRHVTNTRTQQERNAIIRKLIF